MKYIKKIFEAELDFLEPDAKLIQMCKELANEDKELHIDQEPEELPEYISDFVELLEGKGYDGWEYELSDMEMFVNELSNDEKIKIYKFYRNYKSDIIRIPNKQDMMDSFQILEDEYDIKINYMKRYEKSDQAFEWIVQIPTSFVESTDLYDVIEIDKYIEFLKHIEHIKNNLNKYNFILRHMKSDDRFDVQIYPKN